MLVHRIPRVSAAVLFAAVVAGGAVLALPGEASASTGTVPAPSSGRCVGLSEVKPLGVTLAEFRLNSCEADLLVESLDDLKDGGGLAGALGAKWWKVGAVGGGITALSWYDQAELEDCAAAKRGVAFRLAAGVVVGCTPQ